MLMHVLHSKVLTKVQKSLQTLLLLVYWKLSGPSTLVAHLE